MRGTEAKSAKNVHKRLPSNDYGVRWNRFTRRKQLVESLGMHRVRSIPRGTAHQLALFTPWWRVRHARTIVPFSVILTATAVFLAYYLAYWR